MLIIADNDAPGIKGANELQDLIDGDKTRSTIWCPVCANDLKGCVETIGAPATRLQLERVIANAIPKF